MNKLSLAICLCGLVLALGGAAEATSVNGAVADLDMRTTLTFSNGASMTFYSGHGMNGAYAYVYTDVGGAVEEDEEELGTWPDDTSSWSASASTSDGAAAGSVTVNTVGFDYSIHADALVEGLAVGDEGLAMGYAYAWPDWLNCTAAGTATFTIDYSYTLDTQDTSENAEARVFMNAFFADHPGTNYLTAQGDWTLGYGSNPNTTVVIYSRSIGAGDFVTVTDSVSWDIIIPHTGEPFNWWSTWSYGEVEVVVEPIIPEPVSAVMLLAGLAGMIRLRRRS